MITFIPIIIAGLIIKLTPIISTPIKRLLSFMHQPSKRSKQRVVFDKNYVDIRSLYLQEFGEIPSICFVNNIDAKLVMDFLNEQKAGKILSVHQSSYYSWTEKKQVSSEVVFKMENKVIIEVGREYVEVLHIDEEYANALLEHFVTCKGGKKEDAFQINIISMCNHSLELKQLEIKPTHLDLALYYNDDFIAVDEVIRQRLARENDKGIILLHGLPGTGKTTYLRHLIGSMKKKVLFVSPGVAENLMNPEFLDLLIDNPNSVLVIEDAENIIMDRRYNSNSGVSNLLNISDGLLSDCLNVQIICTFNNALSTVDAALMRKGRLIAKYEFTKLNTVKAQQLSDHLGFNNKINRPMSIAEITNPADMEVTQPAVRVLGFRREALMN
jgi:hypothetical protein